MFEFVFGAQKSVRNYPDLPPLCFSLPQQISIDA